MAVRLALATAAHHSSPRVSSASARTECVAGPAPVTYHEAPATVDFYATPAIVNAYVAPALVTEYIAPPSAATRFNLNLDTTGFVNTQFSILLWRPLPHKSLVLFLSVDETASPVYNQVFQEQIAAEQESVERVQQHTVEQIVHVPIPQIQEQIEESVQVIPRELLSERIEEQIVDNRVPPIVEEIAEVVHTILQERFQQTTVE